MRISSTIAALLLAAQTASGALYVNGFLALGNVGTNYPFQVWDDGAYQGTVYAMDFGTNLQIRILSNSTAYVEGSGATGSPNYVLVMTNVFRAVDTSAVDFVSFESNNAARTIAYYVFCFTNGGGGGSSSSFATNVFRAVDTSSVDFIAFESNNAAQTIGYYVFCSTNGAGGGAGGGGAYAYQGTNNIAPTNANGNTISAAAVHSHILGGSTNTINTAANSAILSGKNNVISNQGVAYSCAVIAGGSGNIIGGDPSEPGWFGFIGGGLNNKMHGDRSSIVGGEGNIVADQSWYSSVAYGQNCSIGAASTYNLAGGATVSIGAGSSYNVALGYQSQIGASVLKSVISGGGDCIINSSSDNATIAGGNANTVAADYTTVSGGQNNSIDSAATHATVGGGYGNGIGASATYATVGGGQVNKVGVGSTYTTVAGGWNNVATGSYITISGGHDNRIHGVSRYDLTIGGGNGNSIGAGAGDGGTIAGGQLNVLQGEAAAIGGGYDNIVTNSSYYSVIPGGTGNRLIAAPYSFAAGKQARGLHNSVFVWADSQNANFDSTATNQFLIRASGGVRIASFGGGQDTNTWAVTGMRIVTNANVFIHTPAWQGSQLWDVGSNMLYLAKGLTTNDWIKFAGAVTP